MTEGQVELVFQASTLPSTGTSNYLSTYGIILLIGGFAMIVYYINKEDRFKQG